MKHLRVLIVLLTIFSCSNPKTTADLIVKNANIYTVDANFSTAEAMAITNGKIVAIGSQTEIFSAYTAEEVLDAKQNTILPGFIDAHCHFYGLGLQQNRVDLTGTQSFDDVIKRVTDFQNQHNSSYIIGRGWDQNMWPSQQFPTKAALDKRFKNIPVALTRVDGHAMLCNQAALDLAGITLTTKVEGGDILKQNNQLTGVLIDNPMALVEATFPKPTKATATQALKNAQDICLQLGLTTVSDAGLHKSTIQLIDSLQKAEILKMRMYAMVANTEADLEYYLNNGPLKTNRLNVQSVKVYADGALGSRGAALKHQYSDKHNHFGAMVIGKTAFENLAKRIHKAGFQMNTHAIGDSANSVVLKTYNKILKNDTDKRWRVEHAQVLDSNDISIFKNKNIIPSVQPTHATSDMYWAADRLGDKRLQYAYAYKTLLNASGTVALGTDFPVERVSPFFTFYAAVTRKDIMQYPKNGFQVQNALSRKEALKGMTIWAAHANFEDQEKGSLEVGKYADFIVLDTDIMTVDAQQIPSTRVLKTIINGEQVFSK